MIKYKKKGFTLIELIVVMAVIGILVLLVMPKFMGYTEKARLTELKNNVKQLETASERYYIDHDNWPRLSDIPYTKAQIESFAQEIKDKTGAVVTLEENGRYYPIDYDKLQKYVQKPKDNINYIIQNPVGEVFYLESLTEQGKTALSNTKEEVVTNNKPVAAITMSPEQNLTTITTVVWNSNNSTDVDGDAIINAEWEDKQDIYTTEGTYTVRLRVQDEHGLWSDWVSKTFVVEPYVSNKFITSDFVFSYSTPAYGTMNYLFDGNYTGFGGTAWYSYLQHFWQYTFNTSKYISHIRMYARSDEYGQFIKDYEIYYNDGESWNLLSTGTAPDIGGFNKISYFDFNVNKNAKAVKIVSKSGYGHGVGLTFAEHEVWGE